MNIVKFGVSIALSSAILLAGELESGVSALLKKNIGIDTKVVKTLDIDKNLKFAVVENSDGMRFPTVATGDGKTVMVYTPDFFSSDEKVVANIKTELDAMVEHNKKERDKGVQKLLTQLPKNGILKLENGKDKTIAVISDPECPYCRKELDTIEEKLKESNIYMIFAPVHDKAAFIKSELIYQKAANAKTNAEKIKIIKEYFDPKVKLSAKDMEIKPTITEKNAEVIFGSGLVKGVPFVFEVSK